MLFLRLEIVPNDTNSVRRVFVPAHYALAELHLILSVLCQYDPCVFYFSFDDVHERRPPGDPAPPERAIRRQHFELPDDVSDMGADVYIDHGIFVDRQWSFSAISPDEPYSLMWTKDARTYTLEDVFFAPEDAPIALDYEYTASKAIGARVNLLEIFDEDEFATPIIECISGPSKIYDSGYITKRAPSLNVAQRRLDDIFEERGVQGRTTRNKCSICKFGRATCQAELNRGCLLNSGHPCCRLCPGNRAYNDEPLVGQAFDDMIAQLTIVERALNHAQEREFIAQNEVRIAELQADLASGEARARGWTEESAARMIQSYRDSIAQSREALQHA